MGAGVGGGKSLILFPIHFTAFYFFQLFPPSSLYPYKLLIIFLYTQAWDGAII
jgi:hypothetical protein